MLAARVVLTAAPPTLVFDEVDAGIGGEAGIAVGRLLAALGARHQVLCVTHLAQVAAFADTQVVVEKAVEPVGEVRGTGNGAAGARTVARAPVLDGDDRVAELSRMLAGTGSSAHARELRRRAARRGLRDPHRRHGASGLMALVPRRAAPDRPRRGRRPGTVDKRTKDLIRRLATG